VATSASVSIPGVAAEQRTGWRAALLPSLTDLFFLAAIAWMFMAPDIGWQALLRDGDTGYHIRTGDLILNTHHVPAADPFSFSKPGQPWFAHEWLAEVVFAALVRWAGLKALVLFVGALLALYNTILLRDSVRRGANSVLAIALVLAGSNAASIHFHARPHVFTLLLLTISAALIARDRERPTRWIWALVPLTAVWANLHGGFVILLALLGLVVAGSVVEMLLGQPGARAMAVRYAGLLAGCAAASALNPRGIRLHLHIVELLQVAWYKTHISEYQSPAFHFEQMTFFMAVLFLGLACVWPLLAKRRVTEPLWILFFAYESLVSARNIPLFLVIALPVVAMELTTVWRRWAAASSPKSTIAVLDDLAAQTSGRIRPVGVWTPLFVAGILLFTPTNRWPTDFSPETFPLAMLHKHADELAGSRVFTADQWADYLIYANFPKQRVFIDGRSDFYGEEIGKAYLAMWQAEPDWRVRLNRYRFNRVLCPPDVPLAAVLRESPEWRIVDQDREAVLFAKN